MRVFVIPLLMVGVAALRFAYARHKHPEAADAAAALAAPRAAGPRGPGNPVETPQIIHLEGPTQMET